MTNDRVAITYIVSIAYSMNLKIPSELVKAHAIASSYLSTSAESFVQIPNFKQIALTSGLYKEDTYFPYLLGSQESYRSRKLSKQKSLEILRSTHSSYQDLADKLKPHSDIEYFQVLCAMDLSKYIPVSTYARHLADSLESEVNDTRLVLTIDSLDLSGGFRNLGVRPYKEITLPSKEDTLAYITCCLPAFNSIAKLPCPSLTDAELEDIFNNSVSAFLES